MADGKGCKCGAYGACECGCPDVDWTPQEVYDLRKRLSHLMDVAGKLAEWVEGYVDYLGHENCGNECQHGQMSKEMKALIAEWDRIKEESY